MNLPTNDKNRQKAACGFARAFRRGWECKYITAPQNGTEAKKRGKTAKRYHDPRAGALLLCAVVLATMTEYAALSGAADGEQVTPEPVRTAAAVVTVPVADMVTVEIVEEEAPREAVALYTREELEMLALVIYQEAGGDACSDETRQMVGEVVLNRVADERFPDTIEEVLLAKGQYGRLYWTGLVWPERAELPQEAHAVERAYQCAAALLCGTVERLLPVDVIFQSENVQGTEIVAEQDGFYFCR